MCLLLFGDLGGGGHGKVREVTGGGGRRSSYSMMWMSMRWLDAMPAMACSLVNAWPLDAWWEMMNERETHTSQELEREEIRIRMRERRDKWV
jgi:hypothetical protein